MSAHHLVTNRLTILLAGLRQKDRRLKTKPPKLPKRSNHTKPTSRLPGAKMNRKTFEEQWALIRSHSTARWSLMAEFDLSKVDKAEDKYIKFITLLQVKYGYTRQQASEEIDKFWSEQDPKSRKTE